MNIAHDYQAADIPTEKRTSIRLENVTKRFHNVIANDRISIDVRPGEVLGLLGENGAGKTTLMNVLYGLYQPDEGKIFINDEEVSLQSPNDAIEKGIGMVHQHFMLVRPFTVVENLALGLNDSSSPLLDLEEVEKRIRELSAAYHIPVDPHAKIWQLSVGEQQRIEILNALMRSAEVLIFDEPTAVLTPQEANELFNTFRLLMKQGKSIIFITHKLDEALSITDRITVIRRGKVIGTVRTAETDQQEITRMMVGRDVLFNFDKKEYSPGEPLLKTEGLYVRGDRGLMAVNGACLEVRAGEILGIAGVDGNGQRELCDALVGLRPIEAGRVSIRGQEFRTLSRRKVNEQGVGYIPEDRQRVALILSFPLWRNAVLKHYRSREFCCYSFLRFKKIIRYAKELIEKFDIRVPDETVKVGALSGGNQQKLVLARELSNDPDIFIANQPTRGLDIASIEFVHSQLIKQRDQGKAVILVSRELNEVISLSDRVAVMYNGKIVGVMPADQIDLDRIGAWMVGTAVPEKESYE